LGVAFILGRILHARSLLVDEAAEPPRFANRVRGMMLTLTSLALAVISAPVWLTWSVLG